MPWVILAQLLASSGGSAALTCRDAGASVHPRVAIGAAALAGAFLAPLLFPIRSE